MKIIIYVICYDDKTSAISQNVYAQYPWFRIFRIPESTPELESAMYLKYLPGELYNEWKDADFVGTISWKAHTKTSIRRICDMLENPESLQEIVPFCCMHLKPHPIYQAKCKHKLFEKVWTGIISKLKSSDSKDIPTHIDFENYFHFPFFAFNYWMCTPEWMNRYIAFAKITKSIMDSDEEIKKLMFMDATYNAGRLSKDRLIHIFGVPWYTYHPFVFERLSGFFFKEIYRT